MALFQKKRNELTQELRDLVSDLSHLEDENLADWEFQFVTDLQDHIEKYRGETLITEKQWEWIEKLIEKYQID